MKILILVGSLRAASFSRKLAAAVVATAPEGMVFDQTDGGALPLYNQDLDGDEKPAAVQAFLDRVRGADALIFVTSEFNYGIPGPLKNAIDWASRPAFRSPLKDKPALLLAQSPAPTGGARAYTQLASVLSGTLTPLFNGIGFLVPAVHEKFDDTGALSDEGTKVRIDRTLAAFSSWVEQLTTA